MSIVRSLSLEVVRIAAPIVALVAVGVLFVTGTARDPAWLGVVAAVLLAGVWGVGRRRVDLVAAGVALVCGVAGLLLPGLVGASVGAVGGLVALAVSTPLVSMVADAVG